MIPIFIDGKDVALLTGYAPSRARAYRRKILNAVGKQQKEAKLTLWDFASFHNIPVRELSEHLRLARKGGHYDAA